jgi:hypothetical protein
LTWLTGTEDLECSNGFYVQGWNSVSKDIRSKVEKTFDCCESHNTLNSVTMTTSVPQYECQVSIMLTELCICHS